MEIKRKNIIGIIIGLIIIIVDIMRYKGSFAFWPLIVVAISIAWSTFWMDFFVENKRQKELERKFPEFVRNLVGAVKSGMPISKSIIHISGNDYGALSPYISKLANQLEWAFPFHRALEKFAESTNNVIIKRAVSTVIEAERSGGNMEDVLETITNSLVEIKKIKLTRQASIQSQLVQSYVIFFVFLAIMIVIQNVLFPYIGNFSGGSSDNVASQAIQGMSTAVKIDLSSPTNFFGSLSKWFTSFHGILLMLSMFQGFFAGLVMGKLAEGDLKSGLKHSVILVTLAFFIITLSQGFVK